ncbi:MAG: hypothetical protein NVS9B4_21990 [Candidatus Acidiferrum sp.]
MKATLKVFSLGVLSFLLGVPGIAAAQNSTVSVRLTDTLSTGSTQRGDHFNATLASPLIWQNHVVANQGAQVTGRVTEVVSSGWFKRPALITLSLGNAHGRSGSFPVQSSDLTIKADSHATRNLLIIGGSAALGAAIGGAADGGKGAAIGAAAGGGAGTIGAYFTGKQEIVLPSETLLTFHVSAVTISPKELARLQRAAPRNEAAYRPGYQPEYESMQAYPMLVQRRHHHHGDDDEDDNDEHGEHGEHHYVQEYPASVNVIFISNHRARVGLCWPDHTEYLYMAGNDVDEILQPLSDRIHVSVEVLRPRLIITHEED